MNKVLLFWGLCIVISTSMVYAAVPLPKYFWNGSSVVSQGTPIVLKNYNSTNFHADGTLDYYNFSETTQSFLGNTTISLLDFNITSVGAIASCFSGNKFSATDVLFVNTQDPKNSTVAVTFASGGTSVRFGLENGSTSKVSVSSGVLKNFTWYCIVGNIFDISNVDLFLNGVNQTGTSAIPALDTQGVYIGGFPKYIYYSNLLVAYIAIYNTTLSASEIAELNITWTSYDPYNSNETNGSCVSPSENLYINNATVLCPGVFTLVDPDDNGAIIINASNIVLTCNDTVLKGDYGAGSIGIYISNKNNVTVENCGIREYFRGIYTYGTISNTIKNNVFNHTDYGIDTQYTNDSLLINNSISNVNTLGIRTQTGCYYNTIANNSVNNSQWNCYDADGYYNNYTTNIAYNCYHNSLDICGMTTPSIRAVGGVISGNIVYGRALAYFCYGINMTLKNNIGYSLTDNDAGAYGIGVEGYPANMSNILIENNTLHQYNITRFIAVGGNGVIIKNNKFNGSGYGAKIYAYPPNPIMVNITFINNTMISDDDLIYEVEQNNRSNITIYQNSNYTFRAVSVAGRGAYYTLYATGDYNDAFNATGGIIQANFTILSGYLSNGEVINVTALENGSAPPGGSCSYGGSGVWIINMSLNCNITAPFTGNISLIDNGNVYINSTVNVSNNWAPLMGQIRWFLSGARVNRVY